jgi:MoaA/NifB/PqqE/SkfB family radical SAM enzyme
MRANLELVRAAKVPFGFIFTLTRFNADEIEWVADFARAEGASLLQIHPLEEDGRAATEMEGARPDEQEAAFAYLAAIEALVGGDLRVKLDFADRDVLIGDPGRVFAHEPEAGETARPLAELVSPVVVESSGVVVPIQHGFARRHAVGDLQDGRLRDLARRWKLERFEAFRALCRRVHRQVTDEGSPRFVNWTEAICLAARVGLAVNDR